MKINPKECFLYYKEGICLYERKDLGHSVKYNLLVQITKENRLQGNVFYEEIKKLEGKQRYVGKVLFLDEN